MDMFLRMPAAQLSSQAPGEKQEWVLEPGGWLGGDLSSSSPTHSDALPWKLRESGNPSGYRHSDRVWECKPWMLKSWSKLICGNKSKKTSTEMSLDQVLPIGASQKTSLLVLRQYYLKSYCLTCLLQAAQWQDPWVTTQGMVAFWLASCKMVFYEGDFL